MRRSENNAARGLIRAFAQMMAVLLINVVVVISPVFAAENRWTSSEGLPGAGVTALVTGRAPGSPLYLAAYGAGVFKSLDAGESWQEANAGLADNRIVSLAMSPFEPATLYAATDSSRIFVTVDGGTRWEEVPFLPIRTLRTIVVADGGTIYVVVADSILRSSDGGATWKWTEKTGLVGFVDVLAPVPSMPSTLFAGTDTGLFITTNRGDTWSRVPIPGVGAVDGVGGVRGVAVSDDGQTIYVNSGQFHTSTDGGRTWSSVVSNVWRNPGGMAIDASSPSNALAASYDATGQLQSVYRTSDTGRTWQRDDAPGEVRCLLLARGEVYAGTSSGVYTATSDAAGWTSRNDGLNVQGVNDVVFDAENPQLMYAAADDGVFKTTDGGERWTRSTSLPSARALAIAPSNASIVFASSSSSAGKTQDGGATWTEVRPNPARLSGALALAIDPSNPSTVYAVLAGDGLSKSLDGGSTWSLINSGLPSDFYYGVSSSSLTIDPSNPSILYAGSVRPAKSIDGGAHWYGLSTGGLFVYYAAGLAVDPAQPSIVYAATYQGMFRSGDSGGTWQRLQSGLPTEYFSDVVVDPANSSNVYVSTDDRGVFKSSDRGENWTAFNDGLPVTPVRSLAIDSTGKFLAAATPRGVFTFAAGDAISLPPELGAERLASDPGRLRRLLEQLRAGGSPEAGLMFAVAGDSEGALGARFRSDVTLTNDDSGPQDVIALWLPAGSDGTDAAAVRVTLAPGTITVRDFVGKMGFSGIGSLLFLAIDAGANVDSTGSLAGFSRVWTAGPNRQGSVSQSLPAVRIASLSGSSTTTAIGLRMDADFRTNIGVVNLDAVARTFQVTITGERKSTTLSVAVEPFSMRQIALPAGDYGALTARFEASGGDFPWVAYASSVDNVTGDAWTSQAVRPGT